MSELKDFAVLQALLKDESFDANLIMKDIEDVLYVNASRMRRRLDRDTLLELASLYFENIWSMERPVVEPLRFMHSHAKRVIYASTPRNVSLDSLPPFFATTVRSERPCDILSPVTLSALHPKVRDVYEHLVESLTHDQVCTVAGTQSYLGQMVAAALFFRMSRGETGYEQDVILEQEEKVNCLNLTRREEEVLIGIICAKLGKKWAPPAYVLMGDTFFLGLYSFLGTAFAPLQEGYFKNIFLSGRVYCHLTKLYVERGEEEAERACGKRFGLRRRDVQNRFGHVTRLLARYDRFIDTYCRQLRSDAVRAGIIGRDWSGVRAVDQQHSAPEDAGGEEAGAIGSGDVQPSTASDDGGSPSTSGGGSESSQDGDRGD